MPQTMIMRIAKTNALVDICTERKITYVHSAKRKATLTTMMIAQTNALVAIFTV